MSNKFGYPKYTCMPWYYPLEYPFVPYYKNASWSVTQATRNITMEPGDNYELVTFLPSYNAFRSVGMLGKLNPSGFSDYTTRYGTNLLTTFPTNPAMIGLFYTKISTSGDISYQVCLYCKMDLTIPEDISELSSHMPTHAGVLSSNKALYINSSGRYPYMSATTSPQSYEKTLSTICLCKLTNNSQSTVTVTIESKTTHYGNRITLASLIKSNDDIPMPFYLYVLGKMDMFNVMLVDPANLGEHENLFNEQLSIALTEMCQKWYDFIKNISVDISTLINFIIFYLFYNGK